MADLRVEIAGLEFPNPILPGAGPLVDNGAKLAAVAAAGAGGLVTRTVTVTPASAPPRHAEIRGGVLNSPRWSELPLSQWLELEYPRARAAADAAGIPLIVSIGYTAEEVAYLAPRVAPFADAFELSMMHGEPGLVTDPVTEDEAGAPPAREHLDTRPVTGAGRHSGDQAGHRQAAVRQSQPAGQRRDGRPGAARSRRPARTPSRRPTPSVRSRPSTSRAAASCWTRPTATPGFRAWP